MTAKEELLAFKKQLDRELELYLQDRIKEAKKYSPFVKGAVEHITDLTLRGGKRIRAALLYYSYLAHGGKKLKEALFASMSMELAESYLLIHDDVMDNDILRRGGETIHTSYRKLAENHYSDRASPLNFGNSIAILAGNIACALSNQILAERKFKTKNIVRALQELNAVYTIEQYGQMLDILSQLREDISKKDVLLVHRLKTAPYTFDGPIKIGAILAGASESSLQKLSQYAIPLGIAFQIQDDILGMFGSEEKLGKPVISDLKEGKKTLLIIKALEKANKKQRETIEVNLGSKRTNLNALKEVRRIIQETGSQKYSKTLATRYVRSAIQNLAQLKLKKEGKYFLLGIAEYMVRREY